MHVARLELTDFRSYRFVDMSIEPGISVLIGPNGHGKTNLIEPLWYLSSLRSHRVSTDAALVRRDADRAVIRAAVVRDGRELIAELEINPGRTNRARVNRSPLARPRELLGLLRAVLFAPEDLALVKGDPAERRDFLDILLVARAPRFAGVRQDYDRVLKQRNALLKSAAATRRGGGERGADLRTLDVWDHHLTQAGAELIAARLELVESLRPLVDKAYEAIAGTGGVTGLAYRSSLGPDVTSISERDVLEAAFGARLAETRTEELTRGMSMVGPHRDELLLTVGDLPARAYASQGESWSLALALRLASFELLTDTESPVLILDDVFAELDSERRDRLARQVATAEQIIITAAVAADVPETLRGARYDVLGGEVRRAW